MILTGKPLSIIKTNSTSFINLHHTLYNITTHLSHPHTHLITPNEHSKYLSKQEHILYIHLLETKTYTLTKSNVRLTLYTNNTILLERCDVQDFSFYNNLFLFIVNNTIFSFNLTDKSIERFSMIKNVRTVAYNGSLVYSNNNMIYLGNKVYHTHNKKIQKVYATKSNIYSVCSEKIVGYNIYTEEKTVLYKHNDECVDIKDDSLYVHILLKTRLVKYEKATGKVEIIVILNGYSNFKGYVTDIDTEENTKNNEYMNKENNMNNMNNEINENNECNNNLDNEYTNSENTNSEHINNMNSENIYNTNSKNMNNECNNNMNNESNNNLDNEYTNSENMISNFLNYEDLADDYENNHVSDIIGLKNEDTKICVTSHELIEGKYSNLLVFMDSHTLSFVSNNQLVRYFRFNTKYKNSFLNNNDLFLICEGKRQRDSDRLEHYKIYPDKLVYKNTINLNIDNITKIVFFRKYYILHDSNVTVLKESGMIDSRYTNIVDIEFSYGVVIAYMHKLQIASHLIDFQDKILQIKIYRKDIYVLTEKGVYSQRKGGYIINKEGLNSLTINEKYLLTSNSVSLLFYNHCFDLVQTVEVEYQISKIVNEELICDDNGMFYKIN